MNRHLMTIVLTILAVALLATTGCTRKKQPVTTIDPTLPFDTYADQVIVGYDEYGNPIYGDPASLGFRPEGVEMKSPYEPVYFAFDSQQLNPSEIGKIELVVAYLQENTTHGVIVEGHCDERGSNEYNVSLGENRSLAVRAAMIARGIEGNRIHTRSYGEERPVAFGHDESSWQLNRRAEFVFTQM